MTRKSKSKRDIERWVDDLETTDGTTPVENMETGGGLGRRYEAAVDPECPNPDPDPDIDATQAYIELLDRKYE